MTSAQGAIPQLSQIREGATGVIGVLAQRDDQTLALTARHLLEPREAGAQQQVREGIDLIGMVPLPRGCLIGGRVAEGGCADPDRLLGQSVYRFCANVRAPGKVTALHGAIRLRDRRSETSFICTDIIEVTFDATRASGPEDDRVRHAMPPLGELDAGTLVITWEDQAVGIIVAGGEHRAYVAPLSPFLKAQGLTLGASPALTLSAEGSAPRYESPVLLTLACTSLVDDLAREPSLGLGEMPEAA